MAKDPKRNVDRYKVRGGDLNEVDFQKRQEGFAETSVATKGTKNTKSTRAKKGATTKKRWGRKPTKK